MLFDLSGKRRRVVQVVYATLAILMGGSLVLFGIGSDAPGGILDAVGLGGGSGGSTNPEYEEQIEDAEARLEANPKDEAALLDLARYRYLSATQTGVTANPETGAPEVSEDARARARAGGRRLDRLPGYQAAEGRTRASPRRSSRHTCCSTTPRARRRTQEIARRGAAERHRLLARSPSTSTPTVRSRPATRPPTRRSPRPTPSQQDTIRKQMDQSRRGQPESSQKQLKQLPRAAPPAAARGIEDPSRGPRWRRALGRPTAPPAP